MKLAVLKETAPGETRVAATPESVKKLIALGHKVKLETQAGTVAGFTDDAYKAEGAEIIASGAEAQIDADLILRVAGPTPEEAKSLPENAALIALFDPFNASETLAAANSRNALAWRWSSPPASPAPKAWMRFPANQTLLATAP